MLTRKNIGKWQKVAAEQNIDLKEGVYMGFSGPTYETPAEIRMSRTMVQMQLACQLFRRSL